MLTLLGCIIGLVVVVEVVVLVIPIGTQQAYSFGAGVVLIDIVTTLLLLRTSWTVHGSDE